MFDWLSVDTPFFWCFFAGIFLAAAIARGSRSDLGVDRWTLVFVYLTGCVAAATAGVFVPGPQKFVDLRLAYFSGAVVFVGFFAFRYKVAVGSPLFLLLALLVTLVSIDLRGWTPLRGSTAALGRIHVFAVGASRVDLELTAAKGANAGAPMTGTLPNGPLVPLVELLRFSDYYFFVPSPLFYRLDGVATSTKPDAASELPIVGGTTQGEPLVARLPGVDRRSIVGDTTPPGALQDYEIELSRSMKARIVETPS